MLLASTQATWRELTGVLCLRLAEKIWALSDTIRNRLKDLGVIIEDSKLGTGWRWEKTDLFLIKKSTLQKGCFFI